MDKVDILLKEAEIDIKNGCYNKAVSASYFAVRMEIEKLARKLRTTIPKRDDKLINILKHMGKDELARASLYLYERRKDADYGYESLKEDLAIKCLELSKYLVQEITDFLPALEGRGFPPKGFIVPTIDSGLHLSSGGQSGGSENHPHWKSEGLSFI